MFSSIALVAISTAIAFIVAILVGLVFKNDTFTGAMLMLALVFFFTLAVTGGV